jgi:hypothetical protein
MGEAFTSRVAIYDRDDLMRLDELDKKITQSDLEALETFADRIFGKVGIDVEFTRHFLDRVNDDRNGEQITGSELTRLFKQEYKKWGKPIAQMGPDAEAVMKDLQTDINMPFALRWDRDNNELDLIVKTVMRKKDFKTSNKEFPVESIEESPSVMSSQQMLTKLSKEMQGTHTGAMNTNSDWSKFVLSHKRFTLKDVQVDQIPTAVKSDGMSQANIEKYKQADTSEFPPMVIGNDGYLLDGNHRLQAYKHQGIKTVKAYIGETMIRHPRINEDSQIWEWNKEDPNNPEVLIQGYGRLMLNQIEDSVVRKLEELTKMAERGDFEQIQSLLDRDVMQTMMKAIVDTKAELQATRKRGGPKSRGINRESIMDVIGRSEIEELDEESPWELFKRKIDPTIHNNRYQKAAERLHSVLKRKEKENSGKWRHALGWYVSKIASSFKGIDSRALQDYYLKNFDAVLEDINEAGGVGKIVPGVNTTIDVGPDEIKKQAAKFGNKVSKDGLPKKTFR